MNYKFTFKDWLSGRMSREYEDCKIPELQNTKVIKGTLPRKLLNLSYGNNTINYLNQKDYEHIVNYQEAAFDKGVKLVAEYEINRFRSILSGKPKHNVKSSIEEEIKLTSKIISNASVKSRLEVNHETKPITGIDSAKAKKINNLSEPDRRISLYYYDTGNELKFNKTFELYVKHAYKDRLKAISKDLIRDEKSASKNKSRRVREFADGFVNSLIESQYQTNKEVIKALKEIEPEYEPVGDKEKKLLRKDGTPIEKRICIALEAIFEIKYKPEKIDWTTIRDIYRKIDKSISQV